MTTPAKTRRTRRISPEVAIADATAAPTTPPDGGAVGDDPEPAPLPPPTGASPTEAPDLPKGKLGILVGLLLRPQGARIAELSSATGWLTHSVRGAISGALKARGYTITSEPDDAGRLCRITARATPVGEPQA